MSSLRCLPNRRHPSRIEREEGSVISILQGGWRIEVGVRNYLDPQERPQFMRALESFVMGDIVIRDKVFWPMIDLATGEGGHGYICFGRSYTIPCIFAPTGEGEHDLELPELVAQAIECLLPEKARGAIFGPKEA